MTATKTAKLALLRREIKLSRRGIRGEKYKKHLAYLKDTILLPKDATTEDRFNAASRFLAVHPEASASMVACALGINPNSLRMFRFRNKHGNTIYYQRRQKLLEQIRVLYPSKASMIAIAPLLRELKSMGFHLGINTLRDVLNKAGYRTHKVNQFA